MECFDTNPGQEREVVKGRERLYVHGGLQLCGMYCLLAQGQKLHRHWNGKGSVEKCCNMSLLTKCCWHVGLGTPQSPGLYFHVGTEVSLNKMLLHDH